jgi:SMC interacting uncharacterized protein involved in chromosome segregation
MCGVAVEMFRRLASRRRMSFRGKAPFQDTRVETPLSGAPDIQVEQLDALRATVNSLEATEARLRARASLLSEHLLAAERRNAGLLPAEEEIRRLREEVTRLTAKYTAKYDELTTKWEDLTIEREDLTRERDDLRHALTDEVARLASIIRERDAAIAEIFGSESWKFTAPIRAVLAWLRRR